MGTLGGLFCSMLDWCCSYVLTTNFCDHMIVSKQYRTGHRCLMLPQGASVTLKQPSHLNNFIIKYLLVKPLN